MAIGVLVLGESGTGKTYAIHNFEPDEVKILSVQKPILPFRGKYDISRTPTSDSVIEEMKATKKKYIVVDDFQYILGIPMMQRIGEKGWDKFNEIQQAYSEVLDAINELPDDTIVFLNSHVETTDDGRTKIKTIGKALDKYITIEGLFMIVLGTQVIDGKYYFVTQNNGANTLKSPDGMFPSLHIQNDLKYVADKIEHYYYMDGAKSDEEIATEDEANTIDEEEIKPKRRNRGKEKEETEEKPKRKSRAEKGRDEDIKEQMELNEGKGDEVPLEEYEEPKPKRRTRRDKKED